jgi:SAM-dependent methyltransferase
MSGYFYRDHPQTCDPEDFWGQVKRTVNGKPVPQEQIDMIVAAVCDGLKLARDDVLLDLCCGNGALTTYFFQRCAGGLGVDYSDYLIEVARRNFASKPGEEFRVEDVVSFAKTFSHPERFTKAVCYGSFQYLPKEDAAELLCLLHARFAGLRTVFVGNVPDRQRAADFLGDGLGNTDLDSYETPIGIWRSREEFLQLGATGGWRASFRQMPQEYYGAPYRYDAVLTRA